MMNYVLVYGNRKQEDMQFPFSNGSERNAAFLKLFRHLRDVWKVYDVRSLPERQKVYYRDAMKGDGFAAFNLLRARRKAEYEQWHVERVPAQDKGHISRALVVKPAFGEVKKVMTRGDGHSVSVRLQMANRKEVEFLLVPYMSTSGDWQELNGASHFIQDALSTEWEGEMRNAEGLKKALHVVNDLRHALQGARFPETMSATCSPEAVFVNVNRQAEALLTEYSNTPIEKLRTEKRRPTTLDEANEKLAVAQRALSTFVYHMKKIPGQEDLVADLLRTYKLDQEGKL